MTFRVFSSATFFILVFFAPWWISFPAGLLLVVIHDNFWEFIFGAFFIDLTFGVPIPRFAGFTLVLTVSAIAIILIRHTLVKRLFVKTSEHHN